MSSELGFHYYDIIYCRYRIIQTSLLPIGGGVLNTYRCLYKNFHSKLILIENNSIELLFVLLNISNHTIIIGSVIFMVNILRNT